MIAIHIAKKNYWFSRGSSTKTMKTWAQVIDAYSKIPAPYQHLFTGRETKLPYMVYIPSEKVLHNFRLTETASTLICLYDDQITIYQSSQEKIITREYPLKDIVLIEQGSILLYSWITLTTKDLSTTVTFNAVRDDLFKPFISKARLLSSKPSTLNSKDSPNTINFQKLHYFTNIHFKYMNYAQKSLLHEEKIIYILYQPDKYISRLKFLHTLEIGKLITAHMTLLTDKELIIIRGNRAIQKGYNDRYGGKFSYIPLHNITDIQINKSKYKDISQVSIICANNEKIELLYTAHNAKIYELKNEISKLL